MDTKNKKNKLWNIEEYNGDRLIRTISMRALYPVCFSEKQRLERINKYMKYKIVFAK